MRKLTRHILFLLAFLLATPAFGGTILFLGDSLTAGLGVQETEAYPALIEQKLKEKNLPFNVVNAGLSGDTTAGGLARLDWVLQKKIDVLVLALGANDGLRGLPIAQTKANLQAIIDRVKAKNPGIKIVIAGMQIPPNMGADYATAFRDVFSDLARENQAALVPFLLEGVGGHTELNQADHMHPTAAGHRILADNVWRVLEPLLAKDSS
ncbi:MAG TPA: arylesterase [Chthoniobacterales bacterium]